jgi:hypothetical protein
MSTLVANEAASPRLSRARVIARSGLRLRAGPGENFDVLKSLPFNTLVQPVGSAPGWTLVDLEGDGRADGYVSAGFLADAARAPATTPFDLVAHDDAARIPELIRLGSTASGLAAARATAKASWSHYPANGCAAHLSALLRAAGIDVPTTLGAGKLAFLIEGRGWQRIPVGEQQPGDVGVTRDDDPTPAGADHIYLVIEADGPDRMLIADNQNAADAPHERFATSGRKTPTEYFLRA